MSYMIPNRNQVLTGINIIENGHTVSMSWGMRWSVEKRISKSCQEKKRDFIIICIAHLRKKWMGGDPDIEKWI